VPRKIFPNAAARWTVYCSMHDGDGRRFRPMRHPEALILALRDSGVEDLTVIGNNVGCDQHGLWHVLANHQIRKVISRTPATTSYWSSCSCRQDRH